jgi:hypothetical protein
LLKPALHETNNTPLSRPLPHRFHHELCRNTAGPVNHVFNTLMLKGKPGNFALKAGDSQGGQLVVKYDGGRPTHAAFNPMSKQGGLVLGTGGDNSDRSLGIFYEGCMTSGYASAATDAAIQANIVAVGFTEPARFW